MKNFFIRFFRDADSDIKSGSESNNVEKQEEKTYSQKELNELIKKEKNKATENFLKELGVSDFDSAKEGIKKYLESVEKNKTDLQKANESVDNLNNKINELVNKNEILDLTNKALIANVKSENISDFVAIIKSRINEDKDADAVIKEIKENSAYSGFFNSVENPKEGTGNPIGIHKNNIDDSDNYGRKLAEKFLNNGKRPDINSKE